MKCPVCGYESDTEDMECIACGSDMALAAESIALEKKRSEEAMERYHQQQRELRIELGIESANETPEPELGPEAQSAPATSSEEPMNLSMASPALNGSDSVEVDRTMVDATPGVLCPQCGFKNGGSAAECARCGVVFRKFKEESRKRPLDDLGEAPLDDQDSGYNPYVREVEPADPFKGVKAVAGSAGEAIGRVDFSGMAKKTGGGFQQFWQWCLGLSPKAKVATGVILAVLISLPFAWKGAVMVKESVTGYFDTRHDAKVAEAFKADGDAIRAEIRKLVGEKKFDEARGEVAAYDVPTLANEVKELRGFIREKELYTEVLKIPAWKFETNYTYFVKLADLNPSEGLYKSKREYYKKRLADRSYDQALRLYKQKGDNAEESAKAVALINKAYAFYPGNSSYKKLRRKLIAADLIFYKGTQDLKMALRDEGRGKGKKGHLRKITVWLKNTSNETIFVNPEFFTLVTKNGKSLKYNDKYATGLGSKMDPGEQTGGVLYFKTLSMPRSLSFEHLVSGLVTREFP